MYIYIYSLFLQGMFLKRQQEVSAEFSDCVTEKLPHIYIDTYTYIHIYIWVCVCMTIDR